MKNKNGFTLMELLVSIFISGMVMLSLLAMWKTSSNHTAQAQRQSIIKNDNTIFLRKFYHDFVLANEVLCPDWTKTHPEDKNVCDTTYSNEFFALKRAKIDDNNPSEIRRITGPVCNGTFEEDENDDANIAARCLRPYYVVYVYLSEEEGGYAPGVYRCQDFFLTGENETIPIAEFEQAAHEFCSSGSKNRELIMPYVTAFNLSVPTISGVFHPEALLLNYTVRRDFSGNIPPVLFSFQRYFIRRKGV